MTSSTSSSEPVAAQPPPWRPPVAMGLGPKLAAVLAPLCIIGAVVFGLTRPVERPPDKHVVEMTARLAENSPNVVVVSNSLYGLESDQLGALLSEGAGSGVHAETLWMSASMPAAWYAMLKYRVFEAGHRPKLIIVPNMLSTMLRTDTGMEIARAALSAQMDEPDPVVLQKSLGSSALGAYTHGLNVRRSEVAEGVREWVKDFSVGLLFAPAGPGSVRERGADHADAALDAVFGAEDSVNLEWHQRVIPVVEQDDRKTTTAGVSPDASFIPDLIDLAESHGAKIVFVRVPITRQSMAWEKLDPAAERETIALLNSRGAGWLDLYGMDVDPKLFRDHHHLTAAGRALLTETVADAVMDLGALTDAPIPAAVPSIDSLSIQGAALTGTQPHVTLTTTRLDTPCTLEGRLGPLAPLGVGSMRTSGAVQVSPVRVLLDGDEMPQAAARKDVEGPCSGSWALVWNRLLLSPPDDIGNDDPWSVVADMAAPVIRGGGSAWWVYPGTTLDLAVAGGWHESWGAFSATAWLTPIGDGAGVPTMSVNGGEPVPFVADKHLLRARQGGVAPDGDWTVRIAVPPDGPYAQIRWLQAGSGDAEPLIQASATVHGAAIRVTPTSTDDLTRVFGDAPVWALPTPKPPVESRDALVHLMRVPELAALSDDALQERVHEARCSPVRVLEDGVELASPFARRNVKVWKTAQGQFAHVNKVVWFASSDGSDPMTNGREYSLALTEDRRCSRGWWLYPGDRYAHGPRASQLATLAWGAQALKISAHVIPLSGAPVGDGGLLLRLTVGGKAVLKERISYAQLVEGDVVLPITPRLEGGAQDVVLELANNPRGHFVLITDARLVDGG